MFIPLVAASEEGGVQTFFLFEKGGCKRMTSGVFLIDGNISEGEHLDKVWLVEIPWKGIPKQVIVL